MQKSASLANLLTLNAYWVGLSFMWNALHPIVLPTLLAGLFPQGSRNTYLGLLTFSGLVIAMIVQPVAGAVSDRWSSHFGRRRPLMVTGTLLDGVFLVVLALSGGFVGLVVGYVGLQISSNTAQGPLQGLMRDRVPSRRLGVASSIKVFLDLASLVVASFVAGSLAGAGSGGIFAIVLSILALLVISAAITIIFTPEDPSAPGQHQVRARSGDESEPNGGHHESYWWLISERAAFLLGIYGLQAFGQYYLQDVLRVANPARESGNLLSIIGIGTIVLVIAGGWLADRFGPRRVLFAASALTAAGMLMMPLARDLQSLYVIGSIVGGGIGLFLSANWAFANRIAPVLQAGKYLGLTNLATAGAAALARLQGPVVDQLNAARPEAWLGYKGIFLFGAFSIVLSMWLLAKVKSAP